MSSKINSKSKKSSAVQTKSVSRTKSSRKTPLLDIVLWIVVVVLLGGGLAANYYFATYALSLRLFGWLVLACIMILLILQTQLGSTGWEFVKLARMEMRKVVWPTRQETTQTTLIVVVMVVVTAFLLWGIDATLLWGIGMITGQGG